MYTLNIGVWLHNSGVLLLHLILVLYYFLQNI